MKIELALGANTGYNGERKVDEGPDGVESLRTRRSLCPRRFILLISPRTEQRAARSLEKQVPRVKRERDRKSKAKPPSMGRQLRADFVSIKLMKTERGRGVEGRERERRIKKNRLLLLLPLLPTRRNQSPVGRGHSRRSIRLSG